MKKALKILAIIFGAIVLFIVGAAAFFQFRGLPTYEVNAPDITVELDSVHIARGEYLVHQTCTICHMGEDGKLSGALMEKDEDFGTWYAPNITQHPAANISHYTDGELAYLLRTGVKRNGQIAPFMLHFNHLSDEDLHSIIAFLRSDSRLVQPSETMQPPNEPTLLSKVVMSLAFKPVPYAEVTILPPSRADEVAYGKYLATAAFQCYQCHSASFETNDNIVPENSVGYFAGGNPIADTPGSEVIVPSANLTMHPEHGLGQWTEEQFAQAVRFGQRPNGPGLSPRMPKYTILTDEDVSAIWAYLQTLPVSENNAQVAASE
ncbi:MAG: c-type cytochrome [Phaeodactylibacter sp.]|nr:c-type cytochrome [Phaeodactylibacter sp.]MCB9299095.1 c-type cytochrome [Lewinellaceae bacterium]